MGHELRDFIEQIAQYEGRETLGEIVSAWNPSRPIAVHRGTWHLLTAGATAGYPLTRRLVDLPLAEALVLSPDVPMEDALGQLMQCGLSHALVLDGERLLGFVGRQQLEEFAAAARSRQAAEALRQSETKLDLVLAASGTGVWEWNIDGNRLVASSETREILGIASPLGSFEAFAKAVHPEDMAGIIAEGERAIAEKTIFAKEFRICRPDGEVRWISGQGQPQFDSRGNPRRFVGTICDITERKQAESEREITVELLGAINRRNNRRELLREVTALLREWSGCEAVGIRLRQGDGFPYFETRGFPPEFVLAENRLCAVDAEGEIQRDSQDKPLLECMCGNVLCGRFDPAKPFFTAHGSFWTNCTSQLLASTTEADRQVRTRDRCNGQGYESVALVALRVSGETFGLLQLNDRRQGRFTPRQISLLERLADSVALGLAHHEAQEALRKSKQLLERMFASLHDAVFILDAATADIRDCNPAASEIFGYSRKEMLGRTCGFLHVDEAALQEFRARLVPAVEEKGSLFLPEFKMKRKDGTVFPTEHSVLPLEDEDGRRIGWVSVVRDITERKRAEEQIELLKHSIDMHSDGAYWFDSDNKFAYVNDAACRALGYQREELLGRTLGEIIPRATEKHLSEVWEQLRRNGHYGSESVHRRKDGSEFPVEISSTYVHCGGKEYNCGFAHDITDRKRAEEALRESEERFRLTFDQSPIGAAIVSLDYRYVRVNEMLCRITGYSSEELTRLGPRDITHADDLGKDVEFAQRLVTGEIDHFEMDKRYLRKDGEVIGIHLVLRVARTVSGEPLYFLPTMQDITDRMRAEESLRRSEKIKAEAEKLAAAGRLAAQVAHEINNPLAGIKNSFRLIRDAVPENHPDIDMVGRIEREIDRIAGIVRRMYELYSPQTQQYRNIAVGEAVRDMLVMLEPLCREHEVTIEAKTIATELTVWAPTGSLQQILYNLTINAIQASPPKSSVNIFVDNADKEGVEIMIRDQGHGVPAEIRDQVFEPFFSTNAADSTKKGLGLGLSIVKAIVDSLGGTIDFQSTAGEGTCFRVWLPSKEI